MTAYCDKLSERKNPTLGISGAYTVIRTNERKPYNKELFCPRNV